MANNGLGTDIPYGPCGGIGGLAVPKGLALTAYGVVTIWGLASAGPLLIPLCVAGLLAFLMTPLVRWMRRHRIPEWAAICSSALLLVLPILAITFLVIQQGRALVRDFPKIVSAVNQTLIHLSQTGAGRSLNLTAYLNLPDLIGRLTSSAGRGIELVLTGLGAVLGAGSSIALVVLFSVLMLASRLRLRRVAEKLLSQNRSIRNAGILDEVTQLIEKFLVYRFLIVLIVGAVDTGILWLFGIGYSLLMGTFLGVLTLVPAVGFLIGATPPLIVSIVTGHSWVGTLGMFISLTGVALVEGNILTPKMVGGSININALATFVGFLAGSQLSGNSRNVAEPSVSRGAPSRIQRNPFAQALGRPACGERA